MKRLIDSDELIKWMGQFLKPKFEKDRSRRAFIEMIINQINQGKFDYIPKNKKKLYLHKSEWYKGGNYQVAVGRSTKHQLMVSLWHNHLNLACLVFWAKEDGTVHFGIRSKGKNLVMK